MNGKTDVFPGLILPQAVSRSGVCTAWRMRMGNSEEYLDAATMMPKAKNASGTCRGPGGVLCWLKSVCGNNGCISRQLP